MAGRIFYVLTCLGATAFFSVKSYFAYRSSDWIELAFCVVLTVMLVLALVFYRPKKNKNDVSWLGSGGNDCGGDV